VTQPAGAGSSTTIAAVAPVVAIVCPAAFFAVAVFVYVPDVLAAVTPKWSERSPPAGTVKGPAQVRFCPSTVGSAVVAPVVGPVYENPLGRSSVIEATLTGSAVGFVSVMV
jgi:hypothetical protein